MAARDRHDPKAWGRSLEAAHAHTHLWQDSKCLFGSVVGAGIIKQWWTKAQWCKHQGRRSEGQGWEYSGFIEVFPLAPLKPVAGGSNQLRQQTSSSATKGSKGGKGGMHIKACSDTKAALQICKRVNDVQGYDTQCPQGKAHCCDV